MKETSTTVIDRPAVCGRTDCSAPGTETTVLRSPSGRRWELRHCPEHPDGPDLATGLGFEVVA